MPPKKTSEITRDQCLAWAQLPTVNPMTRRKIQEHKPTYTKIAIACSELYNINVKQEQEQISMNRNITKDHMNNKDEVDGRCPVRACVGFTIKDGVPLTNRRRMVCEARYDPKTKENISMVYDALKICDMPPAFDARKFFNDAYATSLFAVDVLPQMLYLKYGPIIIPGYWFYSEHKQKFYKRYDIPMVKFDGRDRERALRLGSLPSVIEFTRTSPLPLHILYMVAHADSHNTTHAIAVIFYKPSPAKVHALIVNPHMKDKEGEYDTKLVNMLNAVSGKLDFIVDGLLIDPLITGQYQGANVRAPKSSLDYGGYCQTWLSVLMERIAVRTPYFKKTISKKEITDMLWLPIPTDAHTAWRKLVLDYMFTRMVHIYVLSRNLDAPGLASAMEDHIIRNYISSIDTDAVMSDIRRSVPDTNAFNSRLRLNKWISSHVKDIGQWMWKRLWELPGIVASKHPLYWFKGPKDNNTV